ncbi:MAG TPA: VWA domain-containing protein [Polyangiaceae bacterium]|nr:VWA domain-containing protein [Polyangiaceae bacterium]
MRFAYDLFSFPAIVVVALAGVLLVGFATMLVLSSFARARAEKRFGDPDLVAKLTSYDATGRRAAKGVVLVLALAAALLALARPQYGRGTRLIPATNVDVVLVLDYSKSMYARDVVPSRIARAKAETAHLIQSLPGARFAAVAFAGEPISFPLTSDGAAVAQFFRQMNPNDMPVGGTATAKALERARELLARDPTTKDHVRRIVLVTDGEDLEGDPESVATKCAQEGTVIDVVQIGGRSPEVIPEVGQDGKIVGIRKDDEGKPLTTSLSAEGEAQLAKVAQATGGVIVQSEQGTTGIDKITSRLSKMMREELSERVETVYDEVFWLPLLLCVALLFNEAMMFETPWRRPWTPGKITLAIVASFGLVSLVILVADLLRARRPKRAARRANA